MPFGNEFESCSIEIEATKIVRQSLAVELIPDDGPLRSEVRRIRVAGIFRHGPWQQLALPIEGDRPARDRSLVDGRRYRSDLLRYGSRRNQKNEDKKQPHISRNVCHSAPSADK
jgi:hypothetical protein